MAGGFLIGFMFETPWFILLAVILGFLLSKLRFWELIFRIISMHHPAQRRNPIASQANCRIFTLRQKRRTNK